MYGLFKSALFLVAAAASVAALPTGNSTLVPRSSSGTGDATWYNTGLGACGIQNSDSDFIVAIGHDRWDAMAGPAGCLGNPNNCPFCRSSLTANANGRSVTVTVTDRCGGCGPNDIDLSPAAFQQLADLGVGRLHGVSWTASF